MPAVTYWLWLSALYGLRPKTRERLLSHFNGPENVYFANETEYRNIDGLELLSSEMSLLRDKSLDRANKILADCEKNSIDILTLNDAAYPQRLYNIYDPPAVLYIKGRLPWMDEECAIAVAGTRKATPYGVKMGKRMGYELTKGGALVVSGLAEGVDTAAAQGALRAGGRCVGVLGTAIDEVYPKSNGPLFEDVTAVGALVSEYPPGAPPQRMNFPQRNRLLSGLSAGVVIIEAPQKSGSLITAARAEEQGRDVFVVPGNADAYNCTGSNELIRDGAKSVTTGWDVLCEYTGRFPKKLKQLSPGEAAIPQESVEQPPEKEAPEKPKEPGRGFLKLRIPVRKAAKPPVDEEKLKAQLSSLSQTQLKIVSAMTEPSMHIDELAEKAGLPIQTALAELTMLQIAGFVNQEPGKRFTLKISCDKDAKI